MFFPLFISPQCCGRLHSFSLASLESNKAFRTEMVAVGRRRLTGVTNTTLLWHTFWLMRPAYLQQSPGTISQSQNKLIPYICPATVSKSSAEKMSHSVWPFIIRAILVIQRSLWRACFTFRLIFFFTCLYSEWWGKNGKLVSLTSLCAALLIGNYLGRLMAALWARVAIKPLTSAISPVILWGFVHYTGPNALSHSRFWTCHTMQENRKPRWRDWG